MIRLVYFSRSTSDLSAAELGKILLASRRNNAKNGLTGMLVYYERAFLQILEGNEEDVRACYERIRLDPRHKDIHSVQKMAASTRAFSNWSMGLADPENLPHMPEDSLKSLEEIRLRLSEVAGLDIPPGKRAVATVLQNFLRGFERV